MMKWFMAAIIYCASTMCALAQQDGIRDTILKQFAALRSDDFATAFTFASPRLQDYFGSADVFSRMVAKGYPMVWRHSESQFLELRQHGDYFFQTVLIIDEKGVRHLLEYRMILNEGGWRIAGVQILQVPPLSS